MLSYEEAQALIVRHRPRPRVGRRPLQAALGLTVAQPVVARQPLPRFANAAVDGYAVRLDADPHSAGTALDALSVVGTAEAGKPFSGRLRRGHAARIFTGARIPPGTQAVVMQEEVAVEGRTVRLSRRPVPGQHIRLAEEDVRRGEVAVRPGTVLRPEELGLLAALGQATVSVYLPPKVAILTTGRELRRPGARLGPGQIYDSNHVLLAALIRQAGGVPEVLSIGPDDPAALAALIRRGLALADILVIAGGVSVGDRDCVRPALARCRVRELFWKVDIKPGMPLFCGRRGRRMVFGLPGNPVSVFVTFEEFVRPVLAGLLGRRRTDAYDTPATLARDLAVSSRRRLHFVRVRQTAQNGRREVVALHHQGAHHLRSLVAADGWIRVPVEAGPWAAGRAVQVKWTGGKG